MTKRNSKEPFGHRCIWPKCTDYQHIPETKMCITHTAIVMYHGHKSQMASFRYYQLLGLDADIADEQERAAAAAETKPATGTIYALLSGYNVKIGWTGRDLQDRLREYPPSTQLLVHFPGKRGDETRIKRQFAHLRTHGNEWFPYAPLVTEWVEQMIREHGNPDATITCGPAKYTTPRPHATKQTVKPRHTAWHVA